MQKIALFQKNANVLTADGKQIGSLERVVLNPDTKVVTDIVVHGGALFNKEDRVVPIALIVETTEDQVVLNHQAGELESFPPFEERRLVSERGDVDQPSSSETIPPVIYGVPGMGPVVMPAPEEAFNTQIEQNIPPGTVALKEGARVITADEKYVGDVERVVADQSADRATHLLIAQGLLKKETRLIPIKWAETIGEDSVHLRVKEDVIKELESTPLAE